MRNLICNILIGLLKMLKKKEEDEYKKEHYTIVEEIKIDQKPKIFPLKEMRLVHWIESPNYSTRGGRDISAIVLHHTGPGGLKATLSWAKSDESRISYHYVIDTDGKLYQLVKEADKAWHSGNSSLRGNRSVNAISLGIALVGEGKEEFTDSQYKSLAWLCDAMRKKYNIVDDNIVSHKDVAPTRKVDPKPFDRKRFLKLLNE